jgi:hypothetical protein
MSAHALLARLENVKRSGPGSCQARCPIQRIQSALGVSEGRSHA